MVKLVTLVKKYINIKVDMIAQQKAADKDNNKHKSCKEKVKLREKHSQEDSRDIVLSMLQEPYLNLDLRPRLPKTTYGSLR